jgi:hypothetical protein
MPINKLIVEEFEITKEMCEMKVGDFYKVGAKYSYFKDPKTGRYYRPVDGFYVVSSHDLSDRFVEVGKVGYEKIRKKEICD